MDVAIPLSLRVVVLRVVCQGVYRCLRTRTLYQVHCQPSTVTLLHYYKSQHTVDLRRRVETAKEHVRTTSEQARIVNQ